RIRKPVSRHNAKLTFLVRGKRKRSGVAVRRVRGPQGRGYNMKRIFTKIVDVKPDEVRALWLGFIFFFVVLAGYYVIRPVRDNIGANFSEDLWWMFTVVLVTMIVANALFSFIVARMSRRKFIPIAYRFFIANLLIFFVLMRVVPAKGQVWV